MAGYFIDLIHLFIYLKTFTGRLKMTVLGNKSGLNTT